MGIRTVPAPPDARPRISRSKAIRKAKVPPNTVAQAKGPIEASLVLLTDGDWGPGVKGEHKYDHRLAWMIIAHSVPARCTMCPTRGYTATEWVAIDALTGAVMKDFSIG